MECVWDGMCEVNIMVMVIFEVVNFVEIIFGYFLDMDENEVSFR